MPKMKTTFTGLHFELLCRLDKICPNYTSLIGQTVFLNNVLRHQWHQSSEDEEGSDAASDDDEDEEESDEEDEELPRWRPNEHWSLFKTYLTSVKWWVLKYQV